MGDGLPNLKWLSENPQHEWPASPGATARPGPADHHLRLLQAATGQPPLAPAAAATAAAAPSSPVAQRHLELLQQQAAAAAQQAVAAGERSAATSSVCLASLHWLLAVGVWGGGVPG
jgi:hypothetical protein